MQTNPSITELVKVLNATDDFGARSRLQDRICLKAVVLEAQVAALQKQQQALPTPALIRAVSSS